MERMGVGSLIEVRDMVWGSEFRNVIWCQRLSGENEESELSAVKSSLFFFSSPFYLSMSPVYTLIHICDQCMLMLSAKII